jgi:hypothetical protein
MVAHTTEPFTAWSAPSMVTLVVPEPDVAVGDPVSVAVAAAEVVVFSALDELEDFLSSEEQPDSPAMTIAAPPRATTSSRFTTDLLLSCDPVQDRLMIPEQYGAQRTHRHGYARNT